MTSSEFYEWKECIDNINIKEDKGRKKGENTNSTSKGKDFRRKFVEKPEQKKMSHYHWTCKPANLQKLPAGNKVGIRRLEIIS